MVSRNILESFQNCAPKALRPVCILLYTFVFFCTPGSLHPLTLAVQNLTLPMFKSAECICSIPCKTCLEKLFLNAPYTKLLAMICCHCLTFVVIPAFLLFRLCSKLVPTQSNGHTVPAIIAAGFNILMATCVWPVQTPDLRGHSINLVWYCTVAPDGATAQWVSKFLQF